MRRNTSWIRYRGRVDGERVAIRCWERVSAADCGGPPNELWWGRKHMPLGLNLTFTLHNMMPHAYGTPNVNAADWAAFIRHASGRGMLVGGTQ